MKINFFIEGRPSFVTVILDKESYSVSICLNEPEDNHLDIKIEDNVEILNLKLSNMYIHK